MGAMFIERRRKYVACFLILKVPGTGRPGRQCFYVENHHNRRNMAVAARSRDKVSVCRVEEKEVLCVKSRGKFMLVMLVNIHGMILQHAVPKDSTADAEYLFKVGLYVSCF